MGVILANQFTWRPEDVERLRTLHADGFTMAQIARQLGPPLTRNAVIGKLSRLGITRAKPSKPVLRAPPVKMNLREQGNRHTAKNATAKAKATLRIAGGGMTFEASMDCQPLPVAGEPEPLAASLLDLGAHACKWPIGDGPFAFCGRRQAAGVYCADHARRAFNPTATRKRDSHGRRRT
jgi:GcrA cell cycle regulator